MELQQCGITQRIIASLEVALQNLQWNYVYIELPNVQCKILIFLTEILMELRSYRICKSAFRFLEIPFLNLHLNHVYKQLPKVHCVF
jgi:hypothetical protein